jgi:hypothetical protein
MLPSEWVMASGKFFSHIPEPIGALVSRGCAEF